MGRTPAAAKVGDDTRARIVEEARRCFASVGYEGASTRQIAAGAGVAQSLLLYHFGSKDALWRAVMDDRFATLEARMAAALAPVRDGAIEDRLMAVIACFVDLCAQDADIHRIMTLEGRTETERLRWLVDRHLGANFRRGRDLIIGGQAEGVVRAGDPALLYYTVIAIAGSAFSLAPQIRLVGGNPRVVEPATIVDLIRSFLLVPRVPSFPA